MNSSLNPEAPEFFPDLKTITERAYKVVINSSKSSNKLPAGQCYELFKILTDFRIVAYKLNKNVITQSRQIVTMEEPGMNLNLNDSEQNTENIICINDKIIDRVQINLDTLTGINKPNIDILATSKPGARVSWRSPVITKIETGSASFIGAKNIPRPQLTFKDVIDNSDSLWVPKIADKPNNIKPLALRIIYNESKEAIGYEHPYKVELDLYRPPLEFIVPDDKAPVFPATLADIKLTYVETEEQLDTLIKHLSEVKEVAIDLEHHSYRSYQGITCLIQISTNEGGDFIIDALSVREHIHKLNLVFTDPNKIKVFHGAEMDIMWLQRDFGVYVVGLFDTYHAAKVLNLTGFSLKHLLKYYCKIDADKKYQLADWRIRPLPKELIDYARMDTHYLLYIWRKMKWELIKMDGGQTRLLLSVFDNSKHVCRETYKKKVIDEFSHNRLYQRSRKLFNPRQMAALKLLYKWRDTQARELDESVAYLMPNHMLLALAETLPRELQGIGGCCDPMPPFVKQNLVTLHRMILSCRELPIAPQLYGMPSSISNMTENQKAAQSYNVHDLSQYPDYRDDCINLDVVNDAVEELESTQPDFTVLASKNNNIAPETIVSKLNAEAKLFIPPYDRYKKYRVLAQLEEIKEYKAKESKISAIGKDNEFIKTEVLLPLQAKTKMCDKKSIEVDNNTLRVEKTLVQSDVHMRKRKLSNEKTHRQYPIPKNDDKAILQLNKNKKTTNQVPGSKVYQNANYKKFSEEDKPYKLKHPKLNIKK